MRGAGTIALALLAGAAALAVAPASAKQRGGTKTVKVGDNYYAPDKVTVRRNTTVVWKWPDLVGESHDVKLRSGPKGARKFASEEAAASYSYRRKLTVPGTYRIICTLHDEMKMTITVKR